MLVLPDSWTWDFWLADDGERFHAFFLRASRALLDPDRRHSRASVGHAVSADLRDWTVVADALVPSDGPAFDDLAVWTGSVVADPAGGWRMFHTGISRAEGGHVQRIGVATSDDLLTWHRASDPAGFAADPRWYETYPALGDVNEAWRDPWIVADPDGDGWHMLITACAPEGGLRDRGVIGHATSPDLRTWTARPPLSEPGAGFGHLEVPQVVVVEGRPVLIFSCSTVDVTDERAAASPPGGIWAVSVDSMVGPFDIRSARPLTGPDLYAGRITHDRDGRAVLLAFHYADEAGAFVGGLSDPMPVRWGADGLELAAGQAARP